MPILEMDMDDLEVGEPMFDDIIDNDFITPSGKKDAPVRGRDKGASAAKTRATYEQKNRAAHFTGQR